MFTLQNTEGFTKEDISLMNKALRTYLNQPFESDEDRDQAERYASDLINNNWQANGNTIASLLREPKS